MMRNQACFIMFAVLLYALVSPGCGGPGADELADAIADHRIGEVKELIAGGIDVNRYSESHRDDLITLAAGSGDPQMVKILLEAGADPEGVTTPDRFPLLTAVKMPDAEIIRMLAAAGADLERPDEYGDTPLMVAADKGYQEIVQMLLDLGADPRGTDDQGDTALMSAVASGQVEILRNLISRGVPVDASDNRGWTPLMLAVSRLDCPVEITRILLEKGASTVAVNREGNTALHLACAHANASHALELIKAGAAVDIPGDGNDTPLMLACGSHEGDPAETVKILLAAGAQVNSKNENGWTPLIHAAYMGNVGALTLLVNRKAALEAADQTGRTPLYHAAGNGRLECVKILLAAGARVDVVNERGVGILQAVRNSSMTAKHQIIRLLEDRGAK